MKYKIRPVPLTVRICERAELEHEESPRQFAHIFHHANQICVAPQFYDLPQTYQVGILLHEIGHYGLKDHRHGEKDADYMAFLLSGVHVLRRSWKGAKRLEAVRKEDVGEAKRFLREYLR